MMPLGKDLSLALTWDDVSLSLASTGAGCVPSFAQHVSIQRFPWCLNAMFCFGLVPLEGHVPRYCQFCLSLFVTPDRLEDKAKQKWISARHRSGV